MNLLSDSSEDDDDVYINSAARYKALKAKTIKDLPDADDSFNDEPLTENLGPKLAKKKSKTSSPKESDPKITEAIVIPDIPPKPISPAIAPIVIVDNTPAVRTKRRARQNGGPVTRSRSKQSLDNDPNLPTIVLDPDDSLSFLNATPVSQEDSIEINDSDSEQLNDSQDDGLSIDVKVRWRSRAVERIQLGKNENFTKIFKYFATIAGVPDNQILITRNEVLINPIDTPSSINLTILDVLEGGIINESMLDKKAEEKIIEPVCKIKIQTGAKKGLSYDLKPNEPFEKLIAYCAEQNNVKVSQIKCYFDGELISSTDTPESLDLEDEGCVDLKIIS
ncbi:uncharacterized protein CG4449 [Microplitis demolitor]|uniref:uncharacterized protein CG4449 n=1 Tax=Microplitis demolitor TaxID=69319 RepID=UPI00043FFEFD|nr:uncharacterized protein CG4449 [Microplitis demolitor]